MVKSAGAGVGAGGNVAKSSDTEGEVCLAVPVDMALHTEGLALVGSASACVDVDATAGLGAGEVPRVLYREDLLNPSSDLSTSLALVEEANTESIVDVATESLSRTGLENNSSASPASTSPVVVPFIW